jgi:methylglutaconyl-CoA hydratase
MSFATILSAVSARGVATVTLNRPDRGNAFNHTMMDELDTHLAELGGRSDVRVIVLRAAGKHFSAGADVDKPAKTTQAVRHAGFVELFLTLDRLPKATIAVVQGACIGGAAALVACCDVVLVEEGAFFAIPEVRLGVTPVGVTPVLVRAVGQRNYRRYGLSGERFKADEAVRIGLAHEQVPATSMSRRLDEVTDAFLHSAPGALAGLKQHLQDAYPDFLNDMRRAAEHHANIDTFKTPEAIEGVAAFKEKRKPSWYPG